MLAPGVQATKMLLMLQPYEAAGPPLVGLAVNVMVCPTQYAGGVVGKGIRLTLAFTVGCVTTQVATVPGDVEQGELDVISTEMESPLKDGVKAYVDDAPVWTCMPFTKNVKVGAVPPLLGVATNAMLLPPQIVPEGDKVTDAGMPAVTVTLQEFVAVIPQASVAVQVYVWLPAGDTMTEGPGNAPGFQT